MKCNELMVGDWIADELGIPMQILSVCFDGAKTGFAHSRLPYLIPKSNRYDNRRKSK